MLPGAVEKVAAHEAEGELDEGQAKLARGIRDDVRALLRIAADQVAVALTLLDTVGAPGHAVGEVVGLGDDELLLLHELLLGRLGLSLGKYSHAHLAALRLSQDDGRRASLVVFLLLVGVVVTDRDGLAGLEGAIDKIEEERALVCLPRGAREEKIDRLLLRSRLSVLTCIRRRTWKTVTKS